MTQGTEDKKIRILQIGLKNNYGGIESCIMNYFRHIDKEHFEMDFADLYGQGMAYEEEMKRAGAGVYHFRDCRRHPLETRRELCTLIKREGYDIVHINLLSAANTALVTSALKGGSRVVVHCHNSATKGIFRKMLNAINLPRLRHLPVKRVACSEAAGRWMWGDDFAKEAVIYNAVDTGEFPSAGVGREEGVITVGYVGRLSEQKNVLFLPEILRELLKLDSSYRLLVVGDGELRGEFEAALKNYGISDKVRMPGMVQGASDYYGRMDVFVLPSLFEGLPVVATEAQTAGVKCFISDRVTKETDITGTVTFLPIESARVWAEAIDNYMKNPEKKEIIPDEKYDIKKAVTRLEELYYSLCADEF